MVYHLNKQWKIFIAGIGTISCLIGLVIFVSMLIAGEIVQNIGSFLGLEFLFGFLGIELIYEGLKTKIEVLEDKIIYHQSRYIFSAQWSDLDQIVPSDGSLILRFSNSTKISGGVIYDVLKAMNMHSSLAINMYITDENRALISEKIEKALKANEGNVMAE